MLEIILKNIYRYLPKHLVKMLGGSLILTKLRNKVLREKGKPLTITEKIKWGTGTFLFKAPIEMAVKAKKRGIENTLLRTSIKIIKDFNKDNVNIIDVGANYGFLSLTFAANLKNAQIYSFEPHPQIYADFSDSIRQNNFDRIKAENLAVGDSEKDIAINLYNQTSNILDVLGKSENVATIRQITLDNYIKSNNITPDFVKIDVDGYEPNVLRGMSEILDKFKPVLVVETNDDLSVLEWLRGKNYKIFDMRLKEAGDNEIPPNIFCFPS